MKKILVIISGFLFLFIGCDEIKPPYTKENNDNGGSSATTERNVLLLDFTGHYCQNCPEGHREIAALQNVYGERLVAISVHAGFFAQPHTGSNEYTYDFRTEIGNELEGVFQVQAYPAGVVNMLAPPIKEKSEWATETANYMSTEAEIAISAGLEYDEASREVTLDIETEVLSEMNRELILTAYVIESNIINWQLDQAADPPDVENYQHNHVLRGGFNGTWGQSIASGELVAGQTFTTSLATTLDEEWVANECAVVVFVYDNDTKEILQVVEEHIVH